MWAGHLLVVYVASAVACQLGLGSQASSVQSSVVGALCIVTLAAAAIVVNEFKWVNHTVLHYYFFDRETDGEQVFLADGTRLWRPWTLWMK